MAIALIIALGAALIVGLQTTRDAMVLTAQQFLDRNSFFDYRVLNSYGFEDEDVAYLAQTEGIASAEGCYATDVLVQTRSTDEAVAKLHSIPAHMNTPELTAGRMPESPEECVVDSYHCSERMIGSQITVSDSNKSGTLDMLTTRSFTVVGIVRTPLYINFERGSTSLGRGTISFFFYAPKEAFDMEVYTEVYLRMEGEYDLYSDAYDDAIDRLTPLVEARADEVASRRLTAILNDAYEKLADGETEYRDGLAEYEDGKAEAEEKLADAEKQLEDGRAEIEDSEALLNSGARKLSRANKQVQEGYSQLEAGQAELDSQKTAAFSQLASAEEELDEQEEMLLENLELITAGISECETGLTQLSAGIAVIDENLTTAAASLPAAQESVAAAQAAVSAAMQAKNAADAAAAQAPEDAALQAAAEQAKQTYSSAQGALAQAEGMLSQLQSTQTALTEQRAALVQQQAAAEQTLTELQKNKAAVEAGLSELEAFREILAASRLETEQQFAEAQSTIDANKATLDASAAQISTGYAKIRKGRQLLADAKEELAEGEEEYAQAKADAEAELADAEQKLAEAAEELAKAREDIEALEEPDVYVLDRTTNIGYSCFEGDADIVKNISTVFPVFFFLIAAMVCITTMDKMIDEERGQIGTLRALGYSEREVLRSYLIYAGSASGLGVLLGTVLGTCCIPAILWTAYRIMYSMPAKIALYINWGLCLTIITGYLVCMLAVTLLSCRATMREVPAELIRPKAPPPGKRLLMERLWFWKSLPFLRKVTWRNIFRYKKRLFMTLLGVGGCTALLVTGYGIRDSIMDVANYQYGTLTVYDASASFSVGQPEAHREVFKLICAQYDTEARFVYQTSVECSVAGMTKSTTLVVPMEDLDGCWNLRCGNEALAMPAAGEVLLARGLADTMRIRAGDAITLRTADMDTLEVRVSGIFDNNVGTYAIVSPETVADQWGEVPEPQIAFLTIPKETDAYAVSAALMQEDYVINVRVMADSLRSVNNTMKNLNAIVYLVVGMAAGLAFIVLYNLTNININERIREIATINVLGFRKRETEDYLFRESLLLCFMGSIPGLLLGKLLHAFVMHQIHIDSMCFDVRVTPKSYLISLVLTMVFAMLVNFVLSFRLQRINMAEALKSNE